MTGLVALVAAISLLVAFSGPAFAAYFRVPPAPTVLAVQEPSASVLGSDVNLVATLHDSTGHPLTQMRLLLFINATQVTSERTDATGTAHFTIKTRSIATAGNFTLKVQFLGTTAYLASAASGGLKVLPAAVQIKTVPAVAGITVTLGKSVATTGPDGIAAFPVPTPGTMPLSVDLNLVGPVADSVRVSFVRWLDDIYTPDRTVQIKGPGTFVVGLRVAYRAAVAFIGLDGKSVDPSLVQEARFSTGTGSDDVVINAQVNASDVWWTSANAVRRGPGLEVSPVTYRLLSVKIDGAEVVNRGQQAWTPTENGTWTVQVLLYGMTVRTTDALFGSPVSGTLHLVYPDGKGISKRVGADGEVTFVNLPRGQYQLKLQASALTPPTSVALSRDQTAVLRVISYLDIAVVAGIGLVVLILLILAGRRRQAARGIRWVNANLMPWSIARRLRRRTKADLQVG